MDNPRSDSPSSSQLAGRSDRAVLPIFLTVFIDLIGFAILIPVFPLLINNTPFRVTPASWSPREGLIMLGWLQAVYPFCTFIAAPILGQLSDRFGRRPVLALSIAGTALGYAIFAVGISAKAIPLLFLGRAIDGFTGGNIAVAQAAIGDVSNDSNRAKNFGLIGAAFGLGFIIGPYLGGRLSAPHRSFYGLFTTPSWFTATTPFWFACGLAAMNCTLVLTRLPETIRQKDPNKRIAIGTAVTNVVRGFSSERLRVPLLATFFYNGGFTFFTTFFGVYLARNFGFTQSKTGDFFAIVGVSIAFVQAVVVGRVAKKLPDFRVLRWSYFGLAAIMAVYFSVTRTWMLYPIVLPFSLCNGLSMANASSLISRSAIPGRQGEAMGIASSVMNLAMVPASVLVGYITTSLTSNTPLVMAAVCIALAGVVFNVAFRPTFVSSTSADAPRPAH